jgi:hypothetical protein
LRPLARDKSLRVCGRLNNVPIPARIGILDLAALDCQCNQQYSTDDAVPDRQRRGNAAEQGEQMIEGFLVIDPAGFLDGVRGPLAQLRRIPVRGCDPDYGDVEDARLAIA